MQRIVMMLMLTVICLFVTIGCNHSEGRTHEEVWDHRDGFVVFKDDGKILVVRDRPTNYEATLNDILAEARPHAMWVSIDAVNYETVVIGDHVTIIYGDMAMIDQSYPAQTKADIVINGNVIKK